MADIRGCRSDPIVSDPRLRRRGGGMLLFAIILLFTILVGAWYFFTQAESRATEQAAQANGGRSVILAIDGAEIRMLDIADPRAGQTLKRNNITSPS